MKKVSSLKLITSREDLLFVGSYLDEEYYQEIGKTGGWSFMGLRPKTEEELRERQREIEIEDYCDIPTFLSKYIDREAFADDMEAEWKTYHDVQATRENEEGETVYLGFGSGTGAYHYFKQNNIDDYEGYCKHFDEVGLSQDEFDSFVKQYIQNT